MAATSLPFPAMKPALSMPARPAGLRRRIEILRATLQAAERKQAGIALAIQSRRQTLQRLQAQLVLNESGPAHVRDE